MTDWGISSWGGADWGGGGPVVTGPPGLQAPYISGRVPPPNALDVPEDTLVGVQFRDNDLNLSTNTAQVTINGVVVYSGFVGFAAGYRGIVTYSAGALNVLISKVDGWGYDAEVVVSAYIQDETALTANDTWHWHTRVDPVCYSGLTPLPIEIALQSPMTQFVELDLARRVFLDNSIKTANATAVRNQGNKATRVLYQIGFETELSTVLNPYRLRNDAALKSVVCERENMLRLDSALSKYHDQLQAAIQSLYTLRVLPQEYISGFLEYLDSTLPTYRVSLVANLVMLAKSKELNP